MRIINTVTGQPDEVGEDANAVVDQRIPLVHYVATQAISSLTDTTHFDFGGHTLASGERALFPYAGTYCGIFTWSGSAWVADSAFTVREGATVLATRSSGSPVWMQTAATGSSTPVFAQISGTSTLFSGQLTPASGINTLLKIPIATNTDVKAEIIWTCYDGSGSSRVLGSEFVTVLRGSGSPSIPAGGNVVGSDFLDTTTLLATPWAPTCVISGNNLEVRITADAANTVIARVGAVVRKMSTSDAPAPPVNPIITTRAALVASGFAALQLDAYLGLTPSNPSAGTTITAWADQSPSSNNAAASGSNPVIYQTDGSGYPYLQYSSTASGFSTGALSASSHTFTFAFRLTLGQSPGTSIELILTNSASSRFLAINAPGSEIWYKDGTNTVTLGTVLAGMHDYVVVVDASSATLYIDGVAETPQAITTATNVWSAGTGIGGVQSNPAVYPLVSAKLRCLYVAADALNTSARISAFSAYCAAAFGAHS